MKALNVLLVGIGIFVGMTSVSAQEKQKKTAAERAELHTTRMTKVLELTDNQRAKVAELNLGVAMKNEAIRNDTTMTRVQKQEALKGNMEGRKTMLKTILTEEQFKKYEENEAAMIERKKARKEEMKKKKVESIENQSPDTEEL